MKLSSFQNFEKLLKDFSDIDDLSSNEYVEGKLGQYSVEEVNAFLTFQKYSCFLNMITSKFAYQHNLKHFKKHPLKLLFFIIIFLAKKDHYDDTIEIIKSVKTAFKMKILHYFSEDSNFITITQIGCKLFEDEYVLKNIINPLLNKKQLLKDIEEELEREKSEKYAKKVTVPQTLHVLTRKVAPTVPLNSPIVKAEFKSQEIPKTNYIRSSIELRLQKEFNKNKTHAQKLLERAKSLTVKYEKKPPLEVALVEPAQERNFKAQRPPASTSKKVDIKGNTTTLLREAKLCIKEQEEEVKNIETLMSGTCPVQKVKELEEQIRGAEQHKAMEDIERKHLEGLLTFEEAILSKKNLLKANKERALQFKKDREVFLSELEEWRRGEEVKIQGLVQKCQQIECAAKQSELKMMAQKQLQVRRIKQDTKELMEGALKEKADELAKRSSLIKDIKALHQLKMSLQVREFDPTEMPNLGLLCEMSLAQLQAKLAQLKRQMEGDVERKRRCIQLCKKQRSEMIENVKNSIAQARMSKPKPVPIRPPPTINLEHSPDLLALRKQLENTRALRMNYN